MENYYSTLIMFVNHHHNQTLQSCGQQLANLDDISSERAQAQAYLGSDNPYLFLRSVWKIYSNHSSALDDRFDRLNKIVGMVKSYAKVNAIKQINAQFTSADYQDISSRQTMAIQKMNNVVMEMEEYRTRVLQLTQQNQKLRKINSGLQSEVDQLKQQRFESVKKMKELMRKNIEIQNKFLQESLRVSTSRKSIQNQQNLRTSKNKLCEKNQQSPVLSRATYMLNEVIQNGSKGILSQKIPKIEEDSMKKCEFSMSSKQIKGLRISHGTNIEQKQNTLTQLQTIHTPRMNLMKQKSKSRLRFKSRHGHQSILQSPINYKFIRTNKQHPRNAFSGFNI